GSRHRELLPGVGPAHPLAYTPAVIVSRAVTENLTKASWIRRMFEEGARLKQERGSDKVFDFTLGNPEIEPPPAVLAAARRVLESDAPHLHAYMPNAGHPRVREAVAGRLRHATGLPYSANHVIMTVGAGAALNTVLKALLDPGDEVLTVAPFFAEYTFYDENHGGRPVVVQPKAAITPKTRAIFVNSPNNPSGVIYPASTFVEIEALLARAPRPIVLISDEPYRALVFDDVVVPEVPPLVTRSIVATSWSKSLAIPGERIGYLAFSPRMPEAAALFEACTFTSRVLGFVNAPAVWQWVVAGVGGLRRRHPGDRPGARHRRAARVAGPVDARHLRPARRQPRHRDRRRRHGRRRLPHRLAVPDRRHPELRQAQRRARDVARVPLPVADPHVLVRAPVGGA